MNHSYSYRLCLKIKDVWYIKNVQFPIQVQVGNIVAVFKLNFRIEELMVWEQGVALVLTKPSLSESEYVYECLAAIEKSWDKSSDSGELRLL